MSCCSCGLHPADSCALGAAALALAAVVASAPCASADSLMVANARGRAEDVFVQTIDFGSGAADRDTKAAWSLNLFNVRVAAGVTLPDADGVVRLSMRLPAVKKTSQATLTVELARGGSRVAAAQVPVIVVAEPDVEPARRRLAGGALGIVDATGTLGALCRRWRLPATELDTRAKLAAFTGRFLIAWMRPKETEASLSALVKHAQLGRRVLLLEPACDIPLDPTHAITVTPAHIDRVRVVDPDVPAGLLDAEHLRHWRGGVVARFGMASAPGEATHALAVTDAPGKEPPLLTLARVEVGEGRLIVCTWDVLSRWLDEPYTGVLLADLVKYAVLLEE